MGATCSNSAKAQAVDTKWSPALGSNIVRRMFNSNPAPVSRSDEKFPESDSVISMNVGGVKFVFRRGMWTAEDANDDSLLQNYDLALRKNQELKEKRNRLLFQQRLMQDMLAVADLDLRRMTEAH
eukprot:gnl/Hemi2/7570_TR2603_c0_g1_i1.p1 gnl/Hemi2/7570_TR2603_c0_g1~~gnl/Hemi2/7570_TR2603_c0_g1_i1.p1  ORF type:complete len:125 (-),score=38.82 gnl/Hemi2/7570_TR2603_c0_g1_i1:142-516(-)